MQNMLFVLVVVLVVNFEMIIGSEKKLEDKYEKVKEKYEKLKEAAKVYTLASKKYPTSITR